MNRTEKGMIEYNPKLFPYGELALKYCNAASERRTIHI